jgi:hypothetical protein
VAQGEGEHAAVAAAVELEESEVFDQTCFAAVEVAAAANPLVVELAAAAVVVAGLPLAVSAAAAEPVELVEKMPVIVVTGLVLQMSAAAAAAVAELEPAVVAEEIVVVVGGGEGFVDVTSA